MHRPWGALEAHASSIRSRISSNPNSDFSAVHVLPLVKQYFDEGDERIQSGFRLFLTGRAGYHLKLFGDRVFLEPSIAATYWPIDTTMPATFQEMEHQCPNYFLFEPGLHFGVRF